MMSREEARCVILEDALMQAQNTVEFLHGCLTDPMFKYAYPDMTERHLQEWAELTGPRHYCIHSFHRADCEDCQWSIKHRQRLAEAMATLDEYVPPRTQSSALELEPYSPFSRTPG